MNIKKVLSSKIKSGKQQILIRVDVSRTLRPSLKTGIFVRPELFDVSSGSILIPKYCRKNIELIKEAEEADRLLQSFCLQLTTLCQQTAKELSVIASKLWLSQYLSEVIRQNMITSLGEAPSTPKPKSHIRGRRPVNPVPAPVIEEVLHIDMPAYQSQDFYKLLIQYCQWNKISASRTRCYKTLARQLRRFELYQQTMVSPCFVLNYDVMTTDDLEAFRCFVRNEVDLAKKHPKMFDRFFKEAPYSSSTTCPKKLVARSDNYISGLMKRLAAVFHWLLRRKRTTNNPFDGFCYDQEHYGDPIYINKEERNIIMSYDLSSYNDPILLQQRDIFIFQCMVGCRYGDLVRLTSANIIDDVLEYVPSKTSKSKGEDKKKTVRVTLNSVALDLIEKYKGIDPRGRLFPFLSNGHYNCRIREVFSKCGITRIVQYLNPKTGDFEPRPINEIATSHMARRTFIGIGWQLTHDPNLIGKMTGHVEGSRAFARYRRIEDDDLRSITDSML